MTNNRILCEWLDVLSVSYLHRLHADLCVVLLSLQLQLHIEQRNLGILVAFGLHLETSIGERLLERNPRNQLRVLWDSNKRFDFQDNSHFFKRPKHKHTHTKKQHK